MMQLTTDKPIALLDSVALNEIEWDETRSLAITTPGCHVLAYTARTTSSHPESARRLIVGRVDRVEGEMAVCSAVESCALFQGNFAVSSAHQRNNLFTAEQFKMPLASVYQSEPPSVNDRSQLLAYLREFAGDYSDEVFYRLSAVLADVEETYPEEPDEEEVAEAMLDCPAGVSSETWLKVPRGLDVARYGVFRGSGQVLGCIVENVNRDFNDEIFAAQTLHAQAEVILSVTVLSEGARSKEVRHLISSPEFSLRMDVWMGSYCDDGEDASCQILMFAGSPEDRQAFEKAQESEMLNSVADSVIEIIDELSPERRQRVLESVTVSEQAAIAA